MQEDSQEVIHFNQAKVERKIHGRSRQAFVCQYLNLEHLKGFKEAFETYKGMELGEDDDFQAWCDECEKVRIGNNGWNEYAEEFAKIKLVCEYCYFELKCFNSL